MAYTKTEELAIAFGKGESTAAQVVASAKDAKVGKTYVAPDYEAIGKRMQTDDFNETNLEGWDGVVAVYNNGGLTHEQFHELHRAYMSQ